MNKSSRIADIECTLTIAIIIGSIFIIAFIPTIVFSYFYPLSDNNNVLIKINDQELKFKKINDQIIQYEINLKKKQDKIEQLENEIKKLNDRANVLENVNINTKTILEKTTKDFSKILNESKEINQNTLRLDKINKKITELENQIIIINITKYQNKENDNDNDINDIDDIDDLPFDNNTIYFDNFKELIKNVTQLQKMVFEINKSNTFLFEQQMELIKNMTKMSEEVEQSSQFKKINDEILINLLTFQTQLNILENEINKLAPTTTYPEFSFISDQKNIYERKFKLNDYKYISNTSLETSLIYNDKTDKDDLLMFPFKNITNGSIIRIEASGYYSTVTNKDKSIISFHLYLGKQLIFNTSFIQLEIAEDDQIWFLQSNLKLNSKNDQFFITGHGFVFINMNNNNSSKNILPLIPIKQFQFSTIETTLVDLKILWQHSDIKNSIICTNFNIYF